MKRPRNLRITRHPGSLIVVAGPTWREYVTAAWMVACSAGFVIGGICILQVEAPPGFLGLALVWAFGLIFIVAGCIGLFGGIDHLSHQSLRIVGGVVNYRTTLFGRATRSRQVKLSSVREVTERTCRGKAGLRVIELVAIDEHGSKFQIWSDARIELRSIVRRLLVQAGVEEQGDGTIGA